MMAKGSISWILGIFLLTIGSWISYRNFEGSPAASLVLFLLFAVCFLLSIFFVIFFRDPERIPEGEEDDIVSPADGKLISIQNRTACIFMNIHNVHVNRAPLAGTVTHIDYRPGGYIPAFNKDSDVNERNTVVFNTEQGALELTQIAGVLTRRIVSYISEGSHVKRGERIGMIRFGSRVDITVPEGYVFTVGLNDSVKAASTVIAKKQNKITGK